MDRQPDTAKINGHEHDPTGSDSFLNSASEQDLMLKVCDSNGDQRVRGPERPGPKSSSQKVMEDLRQVVFWRVRMWMVLVLVLVLVVVTILVSLALCSVVYQDKDEQFDSASFNVSRLFNGSLRVQSPDVTNQSRALTSGLQEQLQGLYKSSPALGRYFSRAQVAPHRMEPEVAEFRLEFLMPAAQQDQLRKFTLSREMVYNVLRQFLYELPDPQVQPASLRLA